MWRKHLDPSATAALVLGLVLSHLVGEGSVVKVLCHPGERVTLPCAYHYEDEGDVPQLSVQWRSPLNQLLCHYIKHKAFRNCTPGYTIRYTPRAIALTVQHVSVDDFGLHVCSVGKPHEFRDSSIELLRSTGSVTSEPKNTGSHSGPRWTFLLLLTLSLFVFMFQRGAVHRLEMKKMMKMKRTSGLRGLEPVPLSSSANGLECPMSTRINFLFSTRVKQKVSDQWIKSQKRVEQHVRNVLTLFTHVCGGNTHSTYRNICSSCHNNIMNLPRVWFHDSIT
ncbi:unnamed protein product [Pleuronectes platessa]|uniref:Ig-like domain-containing protein n=1 Tax=Pleuronectes platessa TaxID=8262 RepID=A0A9N7U313_PLEPL|nr:unnamed protein product [Pleuronectes platessa]